jgi:3-dehydro-L-gulonate 2-dehydrogenase
MLRIPFDEMKAQLKRILLNHGFTEARAELCSQLFTQTSCDGVYSHGLNRFPAFISNVNKGIIDIRAEPIRTDELGAIERWDGRLGPGNLNAAFSMDRAISLAKQHGVGVVALRNTNHWLRAGSYGWQAAEAGCIGICWTNTMPNMPAWGAKDSKIGNNPLVLAVPREQGPIVLDIAMSQYSYGKLNTYSLNGEQLPFDGGYDEEGRLSRDPAAITKSRRPLPIGYWKGSGLSLMLDLVAVLLSGGSSTYDVGKLDGEYALSQIFIAFDYGRLPEQGVLAQRLEEILDDLHNSVPTDENGSIRYPGESALSTRNYNLEHGIPVDSGIWQQVLEL